MDLATVRPTSPDPVWTTVATGMFPAKNGVQSPAEYSVRGDNRTFALLPDHCFSHVLVHLGLVQAEPNSSATLRARPLWSILGDAGISSGIVRWPLTSPAPPLVGFVLTDRFHELVGSAARARRQRRLSGGCSAHRAARLCGSDAAGRRGSARCGSERNGHARGIGGPARPLLQPRDARARGHVAGAVLRAPLSGARHRRALQPALYPAARRRGGRGGSPPSPAGCRSLLRRHRRRDRQAIGALVPGDLLLVVSGFGMQSPNRRSSGCSRECLAIR